jgi:hypothetical protein
VLVTVEYQIGRDDRDRFLEALEKLEGGRRRDEAFEWEVFEDLSHEGRFIETFKLDSWMEHLRQQQRVTHADREQQETCQSAPNAWCASGHSPDRCLCQKAALVEFDDVVIRRRQTTPNPGIGSSRS